MTPEEMAELHGRAFPGPPRPWSAAEFRQILEGHQAQAFVGPQGFLVARRAGPEAEVLTLCTAPEARRQGHARDLMVRFEEWAVGEAVEELFLEVAETNHPARSLYLALGYTPRGHRKDYYLDSGKTRVHALVLAKTL